MEPNRLHMKISGPLLGKILHERHKHNGNCGGMLFGEIVAETKREITDSQHITKSEAFVCIKDYFPTSNKKFFNLLSQSRAEAWTENSYLPMSSCVGLFKIRTSSSALTLLEKSIHRKLCKDLQAKSQTSESDFIVSLLITYGTNTDLTCLDWKIYAFVLYKSSFSAIKVEVSNLQGSVNNLYLNNPNPVKSVQSSNANKILESFQQDLSGNDNGIRVVDTTRSVTEDLIQELDGVFEKLIDNEKKLEKVLNEKVSLMNEWKTLLAKKKYTKEANYVYNSDEMMHESWSKRSAENDLVGVALTESEYQAVKRRSLEDMQRRSPIVVLERIESNQDRTEHENRDVACAQQTQQNVLLDNDVMHDPFANLVSSAKEDLEKDMDTNNPEYSDPKLQHT